MDDSEEKFEVELCRQFDEQRRQYGIDGMLSNKFLHFFEERSLTNLDTIIIIGSGMSGLIAAKILSNAGCKVIVLEAKDHFGGRSWTNPQVGLDWGGQWYSVQVD